MQIYLANQEAFYSVGDLSQNSTLKQIPLQAIIDVDLSFESNRFTLKNSGAMWLLISLSNPNYKNFTIGLVINNKIVKLIYSSLLGDSPSLSISWFSSVVEGDVIFLESNHFSKMTQVKVQFLGIHLDDTTMSPFVALASDISYLKADPYETLTQSTSSVTLISNWNITRSKKLMIPFNGIYFFHTSFYAEKSLCFGLLPLLNLTICTVVLIAKVNRSGNEQEIYKLHKVAYHIGVNSTVKNVSGLLSNTIMYRFSVGDEIYFSWSSGTLSYQIVLYEPLHKNKIAFALYEEKTDIPGLIHFSAVRVNEGNVWDSTNSLVKIPVNGLYFLALSVLLDCAEDYNVTVLLNNRQPIINIDSIVSKIRIAQVLSQAKLAKLQLKDFLRVSTKTKCLNTHFSGFLLYLF